MSIYEKEDRCPNLRRWIDESTSYMDEDKDIISDDDSELQDGLEISCKPKRIQNIWELNSIWKNLLKLSGAEELIALFNSENTEEIFKHKHITQSGLLLAVWLNKKDIIKTILYNKGDPNIVDNCGRSALHLAAYQGFPDCINLLINGGAHVNVWDITKKITPLHCAASSGCLLCVQILIKANADINAGLSYKSPLHYAVQSCAVECAKELLEAGACPNTLQIFTETPLHVAASMGFTECIRLLLKYGADVRVQYGSGKITPLHLAAEDGNAECAKLLLDAGAKPNATNNKLQTPMHLASLSQSAETLELLLNKGADPNVGDQDGRTPLHSAIVKVSRSCDCVHLLLDGGAEVNKPDIFGYTPLHIAALNEFSHCVMLLINHGGDVTARTNGGVSVLSFIIRRTPDVIPKYIHKLDSAISLTDHEIGDVDCELKLDFRMLVPCVGRGETELLLNFIEVGHKSLLKHPLCETFLFLKWKRIRKFFIFSLAYHFFFVVLFTLYILGVFLRDCPSLDLLDTIQFCYVSWRIKAIGYILLVFNFLSLVKEIYQIAHKSKGYIKHCENWLQWLVIISVQLCDMPWSGDDIQIGVATWQHHIAAIGIFFCWLELMMIVGRFPTFGLYIQMFTTVALNFSKFLLAYSCLLIAFGLSFGVLFAHYKAFENIWYGLLKIVIMMSGELEFEDLFYEEKPGISPFIKSEYTLRYIGTAHLLYLAFVLLVTVILMNLLVGLAVSDIQGLQMSAGLDRLVRQTELMAHLESMLFSQLLNCIPKQILAFCHRHALLLTSNYHWELYIRPNDPREKRIPKYLIKNIYKLVAERKERFNKNRSLKSTKGSLYKNKINRSRRSVTKSGSDIRIVKNSLENVSNFKNQVAQFAEEFQQYNNNIQEKLDQLLLNLNYLNR